MSETEFDKIDAAIGDLVGSARRVKPKWPVFEPRVTGYRDERTGDGTETVGIREKYWGSMELGVVGKPDSQRLTPFYRDFGP